MRLLRRVAGLAFALLLFGTAQAQPVAGRDFIILDPAPATATITAGPVEVLEFFYYGCPVCYEVEPKIAAWQARAGDSIRLRRVPAVAREGWEAFARSFYALEAMGEVERLHWAIYDNFHFDGRDLKDEATMLEWVARNEVDAGKFKEIWVSEMITEKLAASRRMSEAYRIRGVPSMVIDGRYVTSSGMAGDTTKMMAVVEALVERVRKERP